MDDVLKLAMALPDDERMRLAEALLASLEPGDVSPFDRERLEEAKRRAARIDAGEGQLSTWPQVRERGRSRLREANGD